MRVATLLLLGLPLAGCNVTGENPAPDVSTPLAAPAAATAVPSATASPPSMRSAGSGGGARGGAVTAAARAEPVEVGPDVLTQVRADCWMKVESQKGLRNIDQRGTFVEKCVAEQLRDKPSP